MIGLVLALAGSTAFAGDVNCKQVLKYLQTGRSVEDVATTMVISESDVKKCQAEAPAAPAAGGAQKPGDAKPAAPAGTQ